MVFSLRKLFLSAEEIIPFERYNAPWSAKIRTKNDVMLQDKLRHFLTSLKPKTKANLYINKCIFCLNYGKYFPRDLQIISTNSCIRNSLFT